MRSASESSSTGLGAVPAAPKPRGRGLVDVAALAPLFAVDLTHIQCREICEALSGYKVSRINLYPPQIPVVRDWCRRHGLAVELSAYGVREFVRPEGKGAWSNLGERTTPDRGLRFCYLGRDADDVATARAAEDNADFGPATMARLLRIPACCMEFFVRHKREAVDRYADDYALITTRETPTPGPHPWQVNYLAQYFGFSLIHHFPCSWTCAPTRQRAIDSLAILDEVSPLWAETFRRNVPGVVVFENLSAVHLIRTTVRTFGVAEFESYQVRSTNMTPLGEALRAAGRLEWDAHGGMRIGDVDPTADSPDVERAVLWFG